MGNKQQTPTETKTPPPSSTDKDQTTWRVYFKSVPANGNRSEAKEIKSLRFEITGHQIDFCFAICEKMKQYVATIPQTKFISFDYELSETTIVYINTGRNMYKQVCSLIYHKDPQPSRPIRKVLQTQSLIGCLKILYTMHDYAPEIVLCNLSRYSRTQIFINGVHTLVPNQNEMIFKLLLPVADEFEPEPTIEDNIRLQQRVAALEDKLSFCIETLDAIQKKTNAGASLA